MKYYILIPLLLVVLSVITYLVAEWINAKSTIERQYNAKITYKWFREHFHEDKDGLGVNNAFDYWDLCSNYVHIRYNQNNMDIPSWENSSDFFGYFGFIDMLRYKVFRIRQKIKENQEFEKRNYERINTVLKNIREGPG